MSQFHFDPSTYMDLMRAEVPQYDTLQATIAAASEPVTAASVLDLGTGMGETLARVLPGHPSAWAVGVDENPGMLAAARVRLVDFDVNLRVADLRQALPPGPFDLVVSALAIHHLEGPEKADLFVRVAGALRPGGRFVLGDVVIPDDPAAAVTPVEGGHDKPSTVADQVGWLRAAGLVTEVVWQGDDLAVVTADRPG